MNFIFFSYKILILLSSLLSCWLILIFPGFLQAQPKPLIFERFTTENGLPSNTILDIAQDHQGYIWLATEDGLVQYDGYKMLTYSNIPGDSTSLSQNRVEKLFIDFNGDLWIGSKSGLDRYNPACNCFFRYSSNMLALNNQQIGQINAFAEDQDKNLWVGTQQGGLFRYERENDQFIRVLNDPNHPNNLLEDEIRVLLVDKNNHLWIGTGEPFDATISGGGLIRYDLSTGNIERFLHDPTNLNSLIDNRISALMEDQDGKLWVGSCQSGLHYFEPTRQEFIRMMPNAANTNQLYAPQGEMGLWSSCPHVRFIHQDQNGEFWVGTYNGGINHFDPVTKKLSHYEHNPADPGSLGSNQVWSFLQDHQGRLWVGNVPGGLHKVDPSLHKFKVYTHDPQDTASLSLSHVMGVYAAPAEPETIWLGTRGGGLNRLDIKTGRFQHFRHNPDEAHSIISDIVWTMYEDRNGTFWVGTEAGLDTLNRQTGQFDTYKILENNIYSTVTDPVIQIQEDREGRLWLGTWSGGIIRLSRDKKTVNRYSFSNSSQQSFYNSVFAIHEDNNGAIWVGVFQGGLFRYDARSDSFSPHLQAYGATSILEDSTGLFWIGTSSSGLLHYNSMTGSLKQYTMEDGLSSNTIYGILAQDGDIYWLSTGNGIVRFETASMRFTNYDASDGLTFTSFNHTSAFKSIDGQLFFGGDGGLVTFYPDEVKGNPYPPDVVLSGLQIAGKPFNLQPEKNSQSSTVSLSHKQNDLTLDYVGLHFTDPTKNAYKYRMKPYDSDWIEVGTQRTARYTNLDPGEYTFQVIARSSDGIWNEEGASLHFYIMPPWWTRWWAYSFFIALLLGISYWFYQFQLTRKLAVAESKRLTEIDHFKSSLYTNITHEFRTPLTVILGMTDTLRTKAENQHWKDAAEPLEMIQRNGKGLLQLVNEMLDLAKLESGHLELEMLQADVIPYVKYLSESFHSLAQEKQINFTVYAETEQLIMDFDAAKLASIVSNLLSNAIKFTPERGKIIVHLNHVFIAGQKQFSLKIKDNGKGLSEEEISHVFERFYQADHSSTRQTEGTGIGLALTKELVELMQGTMALKSKLGMGSEFTVNIPVTTVAPKALAVQEPLAIVHPVIPFVGTAIPEKIHTLDLPLVLIIEDNCDVASYLKITLENTYQCMHAPNGEIGLQMAYEEIPDVIICDVMMPGMDGFEVCATLKTDERCNHIPIIMLTARAELEDRLIGLSKGADAYLAKPFEKAELMIRLHQLLEIRHKLQQKYSSGLFGIEPCDRELDNPIDSFLLKAEEAVLEHLEEEDFSVDHLSDAVCLSRSQVHRKIKALTGHSTSIYIRLIRLQKAKELLDSNDLTIAEVAYRVGFKSPVYFSQIFKKTFGKSPSESRK
ncbi:signal transduction histidine kinase/ligand-binding sensor domain-containing protein/DNA-binding response OmpR family regulator [Catalinimonas alkaloidigena]|uniref:hybrid sensor histidine kinase/response regulator transcription factor n=1 Tax=Catalinimonas alkaloidigena TaxID=1075417 RepID=UPI002405385C|nr:two-component regulator propeller domain-containing protein [Catalinimonas alkaloidigena]MDF9796390.1 signal transduction histidine kinase/ligand-binding sensor domain-containing protein/DNA-binding response OmpR family regulator [Catalinimonas alkaloidigena]